MAPALVWLTALFMVVPCALVLALAFFRRGIYGGIDYTFTLENFGLVFDPLYAGIFLEFGAHRRHRDADRGGDRLCRRLCHRGRTAAGWQPVFLFFAVLPFWSNYLIRTYAWIVLLNREGLINRSCCAGRLHRRAAVDALYRVRGHRRPRLQLSALRHPRLYAPLSRLDPSLPRPRAISAPGRRPPSAVSSCL